MASGRSINNNQSAYRAQLSQMFLDPAGKMTQTHPPRTTTTNNNFTAQSLIGKRSLADFQAHHQQNYQQQGNINPALNGLLLRSVKPRMYQHTSPISTLSPIEFSANSSPELPSFSSHQRYGVPLLQQLRPQNINLGSGGVPTIHSVNNHLSSGVLNYMNTLQHSNRGGGGGGAVNNNGGQDTQKKMMDTLQELEKQLLDNNEEDEGVAVSVITNGTDSEWSETIQNLMTSSNPNPNPNPNPISPSPTSSSSSSSTSVTTPAPNCSKQTLIEAASAIYDGNGLRGK
ncbi:scarecrow-like protein 8 [Mercurialis annua]|uniref:scarecrow-like protein 8 n=1 Tax=Mercurialis annua TaxID=3986 RepID=UPI00215E7162|nr:scarecrow-like protein 8 [Mercurialis annua]